LHKNSFLFGEERIDSVTQHLKLSPCRFDLAKYFYEIASPSPSKWIAAGEANASTILTGHLSV